MQGCRDAGPSLHKQQVEWARAFLPVRAIRTTKKGGRRKHSVHSSSHDRVSQTSARKPGVFDLGRRAASYGAQVCILPPTADGIRLVSPTSCRPGIVLKRPLRANRQIVRVVVGVKLAHPWCYLFLCRGHGWLRKACCCCGVFFLCSVQVSVVCRTMNELK